MVPKKNVLVLQSVMLLLMGADNKTLPLKATNDQVITLMQESDGVQKFVQLSGALSTSDGLYTQTKL